MNRRLLVGLGNPGQSYVRTRHNVGFLLVDSLIEQWRATPVEGSRHYALWEHRTEHCHWFLMKPTTYMNLSGNAVGSFLAIRPIPLTHVMIAYDDVWLPLGVIRLRGRGSSGGQKGIAHIIDVLGTDQVPRLRIGIDSDERGGLPLPDFVLGSFSTNEASLLEKALALGVNAVKMWPGHDLGTLMSKFNVKTSPDTGEYHVTSNEGGGNS